MKIDLNLQISAPTSAADWVQQSRQKEIERAKKLAAQRAQQYEEEDDRLLNEVSTSNSKYGASNLAGLKVQHSANDFEAGSEVILTLADTNILETDEDGKIVGLKEDTDILENVNLAENERRLEREKRLKRLRQPLYSGTDDNEFQEGAVPGQKASILQQYDKDVKNGPKLTLGGDGTAIVTPGDNSSMVLPSNKIHDSLAFEFKPASQYAAPKEIKFRKSSTNGGEKKKRKIREKKVEDTADEDYDLSKILGGGGDEEEEGNLMDVERNNDQSTAPSTVETKPVVRPATKKPRILQSVVFEDEDPDLALALAKARQLAIKQRPKQEDMEEIEGKEEEEVEDRGAKIARELALKAAELTEQQDTTMKTELDEFNEIDADGRKIDGKLVFNSTTEFATRLQARINEYARTRAEEAVRSMERTTNSTAQGSSTTTASSTRRKSLGGEDDLQEDANGHKTDALEVGEGEEGEEGEDIYEWEQEDEDDEDDEDGSLTSEQRALLEEEELGFLHEQPLVATGMAATLALLQSSGELKRANELSGRAKDDRRNDPSQIDKGVKLEYRDEFGRKLTQKEAFRQLSYKFHGYGPGKKKKEKRLKAMKAQNKLNTTRSSILEGSAGTMKSLTKAQEASGKAHIVIQGGVHVPASTLSSIAANMANNKLKKKKEQQ